MLLRQDDEDPTARPRTQRRLYPLTLCFAEPVVGREVQFELNPAIGRVDALPSWPLRA